jgi:hypothetical protein
VTIYLILMKDKDGENHTCSCQEEELSKLMMHLDKDKYKILDISVVPDVETDIKAFCKEEKNLEHGDCKEGSCSCQ